MKIVIQSFTMSSIIYFLYLVGAMISGYIKTRNYSPDIANAWRETATLQSEVAFEAAFPSLLSLLTFIGTALICGAIIFSYRKIVRGIVRESLFLLV